MLCLGAKVVINAETSDEQEAHSYDIRFYRTIYFEIIEKLTASNYSLENLSNSLKIAEKKKED